VTQNWFTVLALTVNVSLRLTFCWRQVKFSVDHGMLPPGEIALLPAV